MKKKNITYTKYLNIDKLLSLQKMESEKHNDKKHDEMLFIIIHQSYELWFKQIIYELDSIINLFSSNYVQEQNLGIVISRINRIIEIQKLLINQMSILETMTPMDFLEFRNYLNPASGFQSAQFRIIENKLGLRLEDRIKFDNKNYDDYIDASEKKIVNNTENDLSLFELIKKWLERTPFLQSSEFNFWIEYEKAVYSAIERDINDIQNNKNLNEDAMQSSIKHYDSIKNNFKKLFSKNGFPNDKNRLSQKAILGAIFILLYRDEPILQLPHKLLSQLIEMDQLWTNWRSKHSLLAFRMIGAKIGTGGSSGYKYLNKATSKHTIFSDITNLSTYIIPRNELPKLPDKIKHQLGFYFTYGEKK